MSNLYWLSEERFQKIKPLLPDDVRSVPRAVLLAGHEPHGHEPGPERPARALEDGARRERSARAATGAPQQLIRHRPRLAGHAAVRADEPVRPAQAPDVVPARRLVTEPLLHLLEGARAINARDRARFGLHAQPVARPARSVKGISRFDKMAMLAPTGVSK